jgi:hypothetical protein
MPTLSQNPVPVKAWYCTFHDLSGVLVKPADHILFLEHESQAVTRITEADYPELVVNGEMASAMAQYCADMAAGGYAAVACSRQNLEV